MLFKVVDDWKQNLPHEDEARLNDIIRSVAKHRSAYRTSKDIKSAQLWCALLELDKRTRGATADMKKLEMIIKGFADVIRRVEAGETETVRHHEKCWCGCHHGDDKLVKSLEKF